jgi:hypothetical protein
MRPADCVIDAVMDRSPGGELLHRRDGNLRRSVALGKAQPAADHAANDIRRILGGSGSELFCPRLPGFGLHWTVWSGSVDEHFVRDVGLLHLALLVAAVQTFRWPRFGRVMGMAWAVLAVPHLLYHSCHGTGLTGWAIATSLAGLTVHCRGRGLDLISPPGAGGDD